MFYFEILVHVLKVLYRYFPHLTMIANRTMMTRNWMTRMTTATAVILLDQ